MESRSEVMNTSISAVPLRMRFCKSFQFLGLCCFVMFPHVWFQIPKVPKESTKYDLLSSAMRKVEPFHLKATDFLSPALLPVPTPSDSKAREADADLKCLRWNSTTKDALTLGAIKGYSRTGLTRMSSWLLSGFESWIIFRYFQRSSTVREYLNIHEFIWKSSSFHSILQCFQPSKASLWTNHCRALADKSSHGRCGRVLQGAVEQAGEWLVKGKGMR